MSSARAAATAQVPYASTIHVRDHCLCLHVQRAARALARRFDEELQPLHLTNGQFSLLMSLNRPQPASMASVAGLLAMDRTTLTAALKPLALRGLLQIAVGHNDRRSRLLTLTGKGRAILATALPIWERTHREVEAVLPRGSADGFRDDLKALHSALLGKSSPVDIASLIRHPKAMQAMMTMKSATAELKRAAKS